MKFKILRNGEYIEIDEKNMPLREFRDAEEETESEEVQE